MSLLRLTATVVRRKRLLFACALGGALIGGVFSLTARPRYRSTGKVALEERETPSIGGLAGIASQFAGVTLGSHSLQFYAELLGGRQILTELALDTFPDPHRGNRPAPLRDILVPPGDEPARRIADAVDLLQLHAVSTTTNDRTGTLTFAVELADAALAEAVARRLYDRLELYNYETRKTAAGERRRFAERELLRAKTELQSVEDQMRGFLETNRGGLDQPRLSFGQARIQRQINLIYDSYLTLARDVQEAKIAEVRDLAMFTLVERPQRPLDRVYPRRKRMLLVGLLLGAAFGVAWVMLQSMAGSARSLDPAGYRDLVASFRRAR